MALFSLPFVFYAGDVLCFGMGLQNLQTCQNRVVRLLRRRVLVIPAGVLCYTHCDIYRSFRRMAAFLPGILDTPCAQPFCLVCCLPETYSSRRIMGVSPPCRCGRDASAEACAVVSGSPAATVAVFAGLDAYTCGACVALPRTTPPTHHIAPSSISLAYCLTVCKTA